MIDKHVLKPQPLVLSFYICIILTLSIGHNWEPSLILKKNCHCRVRYFHQFLILSALRNNYFEVNMVKFSIRGAELWKCQQRQCHKWTATYQQCHKWTATCQQCHKWTATCQQCHKWTATCQQCHKWTATCQQCHKWTATCQEAADQQDQLQQSGG